MTKKYFQGDGESVPDTPPVEAAEDSKNASEKLNTTLTEVSKPEKKDGPFTLQLSVDFMAILLFSLGLASRFLWLDHPRNVVFDEMHYAKVSLLFALIKFYD